MHNKALIAVGFALALSACGEPSLEVNVPLAIVNVSPHDGATEVDLQAEPVVCFNRDMDPALAEGFLVLQTEASGAEVGQGISQSGSPRCLVIEHVGLESDGAYVVRAKEGLAAADGSELAVEIVSRFRTRR
ncbi:MAG: Ig-like domain-containing protein [Myxococcales bacterium]|jgi:hypothetical protein